MVQVPEVFVREIFHDEAGCLKVGAFNNISELNDVWMVELLQEVVFSFYFFFSDG